MLTIRMRREGAKKRPFFRMVVAEGRNPREGSFKESLGTYDPRTKPESVKIDRERLAYWIGAGARPSDTVRTLLSRHKLVAAAVAAAAEAAPAAPTA
jgi:small subunit ribosomal protein S16